MRLLTAFLSGAIFAVGLALSGMTLPSKVVGFLDIGGNWDPSLAFVMVGAIAVYGLGYRLVMGRERPVLDQTWHVPTNRKIDPRLLAGSALFGLGWGLGGYCPGPALTAAGTGAGNALLFVASMLAGSGLYQLWSVSREARSLAASKG